MTCVYIEFGFLCVRAAAYLQKRRVAQLMSQLPAEVDVDKLIVTALAPAGKRQ